MKILGMGMPELLIILAVVLLIFGPKNLPKLGASIGKTVKGLRDGMSGGEEQVENAELSVVSEEDAEAEAAPKKTVVAKASKKASQTA